MLRRFLDGVYAASLAMAALFLVGVFLLMIGEAVFRTAGSYIKGANEMVGWFCAAAGFLALPATFKRGDMVRVGFVVDSLPPAVRKAMLLVCLAIAWVFVTYMLKSVGSYLFEGWRYEETTQGMIMIPVWIPQLSFLVGVALLWLAIVDECVTVALSPAHSVRAEKSMKVEDLSLH